MPWQVVDPKERKRAQTKLRQRAHYDRAGKPYRAQFIDGYEHQSYPNETEDETFLEELIGPGSLYGY